MRVFVTGGTGFIGEHLIRKLLDRGYEVNAIYRSESKLKEANVFHNNLRWFKGDITDFASLENSIIGCSYIFHTAAYAMAREKEKNDFYRYNVDGTKNILDLALKYNVKKVVVTSTAGVFGPSIEREINEDSVPSVPYFTGYEHSKAECEKLIKEYVNKGLNIVIVNPTRVFGYGRLSQSNSTTIMIKKFIEGKWHFIPGNGKSVGNYSYVNDVVLGHILAMEKGVSGEKYILGGENLSFNEFFEKLKKVSGKNYFLIKIPFGLMLMVAYLVVLLHKLNKKYEPPFTPAKIRKFNNNWQTSLNKAIQELGYEVTPFEKALKETIDLFTLYK